MTVKNRTIFTRDCLEVMRGMKDGCIDLIYLDPPFNSNANYAAPVGSKAAGAEFKDTWSLSDVDLAWHGEIAEQHPGLYEHIRATGLIHGASMKAYLIYMSARLMEMYRLLKPTGSIFLHCDYYASHYLKLVMDAIFCRGRASNLRNEIIWCFHGPGSPNMKQFNRKSNTIFWYSKSKDVWTFNREEVRAPYKDPQQSLRRAMSATRTFTQQEVSAVRRKGKVPENWWEMRIAARSKREYVNYPTQKPLALLQRIVKAASSRGEMVLDPFCGCATACIAAEIEGRKWIGIDVSEKAYELVKIRLREQVLAVCADDADTAGRGRAPIDGEVIHRTDIPLDRRGKPSRDIKHRLYGQQEGRCNGCKVHFPFRNMTLDHIIPKSKGGSDTDDNLQLLCNACNSKKGNRSMEELIAVLNVERGMDPGVSIDN